MVLGLELAIDNLSFGYLLALNPIWSMMVTWFSTNMAISMNMSWSSFRLLSSRTMSRCRDSISLRACREICESIIYRKRWDR